MLSEMQTSPKPRALRDASRSSTTPCRRRRPAADVIYSETLNKLYGATSPSTRPGCTVVVIRGARGSNRV